MRLEKACARLDGGGTAARSPAARTSGTAARPPLERASARGLADPAELVALVACTQREALLRAHRHRLREADLEDCYSQATLELLASVQGGRRYAGREHLANALEQRFLSRVWDRRRAVGGRSPLQAALEGALALAGPGSRGVEVRDLRAEIHPLVARRMQLEHVLASAPRLTADQRLVMACQIAGIGRAEFCAHFGWSFEKYRKVAQRGRARLRVLMDVEHDTPRDVAPGDVAPGEDRPGDDRPDDDTAEHDTPEDVAPEDAAPGDVAPETPSAGPERVSHLVGRGRSRG